MGEEIKRRFKAFWNDSEGLSHKDWLLLWSTLVFFGFISVGLVFLLLEKKIDELYIELLKMVSNVVMSIVAGVFGLNIASEIKKSNSNKNFDISQGNEYSNINNKEEYYDSRSHDDQHYSDKW